MELPTLSGRRGFSRLMVLLSLTATASFTYAQSAHCTAAAVPVPVRAEGLTEQLGDIVLQCSGATPSSTLSSSLTVFLPVPVTNRLDANGMALNATLYSDYGSGYIPTAITGAVQLYGIVFSGISLTVPPSGAINLKVSGIRAAVYGAGAQPISATLSFSLPLDRAQVIVAIPQASLFTTIYQTGITCTGSPLPTTITVFNLLNGGTAFASTRLTEGFGSAFMPRATGDDTGTRFVLSYSGFPSQTQLYLPDFIAGSDAAIPGVAGDLGGTPAIGEYLPGSGTLLLARVPSADSTGAGGQAMTLSAGTGPLILNGASALSLTAGAGYAVYEVIDASPNTLESAQIPTFIGIQNVTAAATAQETVTLAPVSTVAMASATAPVPRFAAATPASDCSIVGDCGASYFPKLSVSTSPLAIRAYAGGGIMLTNPGYAPILNAGGGTISYTIAINYLSGGTGWLKLWNNPNSVEVTAITTNLQPGTYTASIVVNAGAAGTATIPLTLTVIAAPLPLGPVATVTSVVNSATFTATPLVAGSLGTVLGSGFSGSSVSVTFDGSPATVLYSSATQINLQVPAGLPASKTTCSMVVTVDGTASTPVQVALSPAWPSIFATGVLNQDYSVNSASAPAKPGDILQIFATGIPAAANVSVQIGNQSNLLPVYAGAAPGITGVQQVDVAVPSGLNGTPELTICAMVSGQTYCSAGNSATIQSMLSTVKPAK